MSPHDIREFLRKRPFAPFRLHTTEGRTYDVRHPDQALVLLTRVIVPAKDRANGDFPDQVDHLALAHVVRIEELQIETPRSTN